MTSVFSWFTAYNVKDMYLNRIVTVNFRSCKLLTYELRKDDPNIMIGINDCGKSTLLKSIGLLLDEKPSYNFQKEASSKKDFSNTPVSDEALNELLAELSIPKLPYFGRETIILGAFSVEEDDLTNSDINSASNQILWVLDNFDSKVIWYARIFDSETGNVKSLLLTPDVYDVGDEPSQLYKLTDSKLQAKRKEKRLSDEEISNSNQSGRYSKLEIVKALYNRTVTIPCWIDYKFEKNVFPTFKYLDWNSSFDNVLSTASEALGSILNEFIGPLKQAANM
ncbi:MAG: DUF2813 domain-containing protein, partial [Proteobacteria bacterium]